MGFFDKAKSLGSKTVEEGKKYAEIAKLNMSVSSCEGQIKDCESGIGKMVAERYADRFAEDSDIEEQLSRINDLNQKIDSLKEKINEIRNPSPVQSAEVAAGQETCEIIDDRTDIVIILPESEEQQRNES